MFSILAQAALTIFLSSVHSATAAPSTAFTSRATTCNGYPELCSKSYGTTAFVGAHNSYAVGQNNLATNQDYNVTQQLDDGIRLLQMQAHTQNGDINLCHSNCALYNGGTMRDYLSEVKSWMDRNPNDVVTILIVNQESLEPTMFAPSFEASGLANMAYRPSIPNMPFGQWPTLGELIDAGQRLVVFMDFHANTDQVPYIIDELANIWETAFDVTDPSFPCDLNRTRGDQESQMYLINHFLDEPSAFGVPAPKKSALNVTNAVEGFGSLGAEVQTCTTRYGRAPNFLLVDFYNYGGGSVFQVAASINGVPYDASRKIAPPIPDSATGGPGTATSDSQPRVRSSIPWLWLTALALLFLC